MRGAAPYLVLAGVLAATVVLFLPLCGFLNRCGCRVPGAGGAARCNVQSARGPHCPWCEHPALGGGVAAGTVGGQAFALWLVRRRGKPWLQAALAALLALPMGLTTFAAVAWLTTDYPHFVVEDARSVLRLPKGPLRCVVVPGSSGVPDCCPPSRAVAAETQGRSR